MSTQEKIGALTGIVKKLVSSGKINEPQMVILSNRMSMINAKLMVLNKFEGELNEQLNILDGEIQEITTGEEGNKHSTSDI
jgi:hypothetical protein